MSLLDSLQHFLENTPDEEIKRIWDSGNHLDKSGVKVIDWLKQKGIMQGKGNNIDELCKIFDNYLKYTPLFKTVNIDNKNRHFYYYENGNWLRGSFHIIHKLYMRWLTHPLATTYKDTEGNTVFALKKEH